MNRILHPATVESIPQSRLRQRLRMTAKLFLLLYGFAILLWLGLDVWFTNLKVASAFGLGALALPFLPLAWLDFKKPGTLRKWASAAYLLLLIPITLIVIFTANSALRDLRTGNGLRKVYEGEIGNGKWIAAFRTPDQGALGGDYLVAYTVRKLCCGFEMRKYAGRLSHSSQGFPEVEVAGKKYSFPASEILYRSGNLHYGGRDVPEEGK